MAGEMKGFTVYEVKKPDQIANLSLHYVPVMRTKFAEILEATRVIELYQKMKK